MNHLLDVLCALDVETSEDVLREADRIARDRGTRLTVLHVVPDGYPGVPMSPDGSEQALLEQQRLGREMGEYLYDLVERVTGRSAGEVAVVVESGIEREAIIEAAIETQAGLIVLGAVGSSDETKRARQLGSVAKHVARHAPMPVLVVRGRRVGGPVLAGTDFTAEADHALQVAADEARARQAPLVVAHCLAIGVPEVAAIGDPGVAPSVTLAAEFYEAALPVARSRLAKSLESISVPAEPIVTEAPPPLGLTELAQRVGADLVVLGGPRRSTIGRMVLGDVASAVVREAPCSVLVTHEPAETRH